MQTMTTHLPVVAPAAPSGSGKAAAAQRNGKAEPTTATAEHGAFSHEMAAAMVISQTPQPGKVGAPVADETHAAPETPADAPQTAKSVPPVTAHQPKAHVQTAVHAREASVAAESQAAATAALSVQVETTQPAHTTSQPLPRQQPAVASDHERASVVTPQAPPRGAAPAHAASMASQPAADTIQATPVPAYSAQRHYVSAAAPQQQSHTPAPALHAAVAAEVAHAPAAKVARLSS